MKILFYLHRFPAIGGIENVTTFLANAFVRDGHKVEIISHVCSVGQEGAQALDPNVHIQTMPETICYSRRNRIFLQRHLLKNSPDVVIFQDSYAPIERNLLPLERNIPVVVCEHNAPYSMYLDPVPFGWAVKPFLRWLMNPIRSRLRKRFEVRRKRFLYKMSWRYVLLSSAFLGEFRAQVNLLDSRKVLILPNACPVNPVRKSDVSKRDEIIFVGALDFRKGCDILMHVWGRLCREYHSWTLTFVGDGPLRAELERIVKTEGVENVRFVGWQSDVCVFMKRARIFAFPSRREGVPLSLLEAMANGCVPIVFDSFAAGYEIIDAERNGLVIPSFDVEAFADGLKYLMKNSERLDCMSTCATESVMKFSDGNVIKRWKALLVELAAV